MVVEIEPLLVVVKHLHCRPVSARIEFKVITMTFKSLHGMAPEYATELLDFIGHHYAPLWN